MKRFIITNLLAAVVLPMLACAGIGTYNYYLFSLYEGTEFSDRMQRICNSNWKAYLGLNEDAWFSFDADAVAEAAQKKNDQLMVSYVKELEKYLDVASSVYSDSWDYPSKETLADRKTKLESVRTYAATKLRTALRSQHALLYMRANMMLNRHAENVTFWETVANQYIESVYKDMMKNIYAGALYKTGQESKAGELFAEQGDYSSLMTVYYLKRSCKSISDVYQQDANARVLPFLLQDFVNNAQEADDVNKEGAGLGGKLFIRDISKTEAQQMIALCEQAVNEQKSENLIMWQTAKAWLEYMFADKQQSLADIVKACSMQGTERMADCARIIRIYIEAALTKQGEDFDNWIGKELRWLHEKSYGASDYGYHYNAYTRIIQQQMAKRYSQEGSAERAVGLYSTGNFGDASYYLDTTSIANVQKYATYLTSTPQTELDRFVQYAVAQGNGEVSADQTNDLLGTKYLRLCQWENAIEWLSKVPAAYYAQKGYAAYAALRKTNVEPWMKRQWLTSKQAYDEDGWILPGNPKLLFAQEMLSMEGQLNILTDDARLQCCYDLAVRYAQANFTGDCWFLMRDTKSLSDTVRPNEVDLGAKALSLLREASEATDLKLKEKALFALSYGDLLKELWYDAKWNSDKGDYDITPNRTSQQWLAFAKLAEFEKSIEERAPYVTLCDEYDTFSRFYNQ